jgi:hypothetical protein
MVEDTHSFTAWQKCSLRFSISFFIAAGVRVGGKAYPDLGSGISELTIRSRLCPLTGRSLSCSLSFR